MIIEGTVGKLLAVELGFTRQRNRKADESARHPDRNAQFEHINAKVMTALAAWVSLTTLSVGALCGADVGFLAATSCDGRANVQSGVSLHSGSQATYR